MHHNLRFEAPISFPKLPLTSRSVSVLIWSSGINLAHNSRNSDTDNGRIFSTRARERTVGNTDAKYYNPSSFKLAGKTGTAQKVENGKYLVK